MGNSLRDQLKKAGVADDDKLKKAKKAKHKKSIKQRHNKAELVDEHKIQTDQSLNEKVERDRQLNLAKKAEADQKAVAAQIRQIIELNRIVRDGGDVAFNFSDNGVVSKLFVTDTIQREISEGWLAIVKLDDGYEIVPAVAARKIALRDEHAIVVLNEADASVDGDDPYADFQVPDDLMW